MIIFLIALFFAFIFVIFALQNFAPVTLFLGNYQIDNIPVYAVAVIFLFMGILIAWIINLISSVSSFFILEEKNKVIDEWKTVINQLVRRLHLLEIELDKVKKSLGKKAPSDDRSL